MKRLILIAWLAVPFIANATGVYGIRASRLSSGKQGLSFRVAVEPLLDAEWWAEVAVSCRLRSNGWLTAVEAAIDDQAATAANSIWKDEPGSVGQNIESFISAQKDFRRRAADAPPSECGALRSAGELDELDQMAASHHPTARDRFFTNECTGDSSG